MNKINQELLLKIVDLHEIPKGAVSYRENGESKVLNSTANIQITKKENNSGLDIYIKDNTQNESLHIPVIISKDGINETVYNDIYIGKNCDVLIVAGCGIHANKSASSHNGIHTLNIGSGSKVRYVERHFGDGKAEKELSPTTLVNIGDNSICEMETHQISGVETATRVTKATINQNAKLIVKEKILTEETQVAKSTFNITLDGENSSAEVVSRVVAKGNSHQTFDSVINGKAASYGRVECDGILLDNAQISSTPAIVASHPSASLTHEAQIGKIAGEQLTKLMSLGLSQVEAEQEIINGFLNL